MRQQDTRAVGQIAFAVVVWSSCRSVVAACDSFTTSCDDDDGGNDDNGLSRQAVIGIVAASSALALFLAICGLCLRRRRLRQRAIHLPHISNDRVQKQSPNPLKQSYTSVPGYPVYHQATLPASPPLHTPGYPPRGYDTHHSDSQPQRLSLSNVHTIPGAATPVSPVSLRASSSITSRPISSLDTTPLPLRSSVRRDEHVTAVSPPSSPTTPASPRSPQRNVLESSLPPLPPSSLPRTPSLVVPPPASPPSPQSRSDILPPKVPRPFVLAPMSTGTSSNNLGEAPPAYTPI